MKRAFSIILLALTIASTACTGPQVEAAGEERETPPSTKAEASNHTKIAILQKAEDTPALPAPQAISSVKVIEEDLAAPITAQEETLLEPTAEALLIDARSARIEGDYSRAKALYEETIDAIEPMDPIHDEVRGEFAEILGQHGDFSALIELLSPQETPLSTRERVLLAEALEAEGDDLGAASIFSSLALESDEILGLEFTQRAKQVIAKMGGPSLTTLSSSAPFTPEGRFATLLLAEDLLSEGNHEGASTLFRQLYFMNPNDPEGKKAGKHLSVIEGERGVKAGHLGVILPLTGRLAPFGKKALRGILLGSNLLSGDSPSGLTLLIRDTEGTPDGAVKAIEELANEGVTGIIGPLKSNVAEAAALAARAHSVPLLALSPAREISGGEVFNLFMREEDEVDRLVKYATETLGLTRFAIITPDTELGWEYRNLFWDATVRYGGEIAASETFPPDETSLEDPLKKATGLFGLSKRELREHLGKERFERTRQEANKLTRLGVSHLAAPYALPDFEEEFAAYDPRPEVDFQALFLPVSPSIKAAQMAPQLPYYEISGVILLGIRAWNYPDLTKVGKEYVDMAHFPAEWEQTNEEGARFSEAFARQYGTTPGVLEAYGYDAISIASVARGLLSRKAFADNLSKLWGAKAVTGPLTTHPTGEIAVEPKILFVSGRDIKTAPPASY